MKKLITLFSVAALMFAFNGLAHAGCGGCGTDHSKAHSHEDTKATSASAKIDEKARMDIVETAVDAGSFRTLVAAVKAAGLVEALKGDGPFTVFAPTDEAFAKLPEGTVEALLKDKEKLTAILTYHVVPGSVKAADVVKLDKAETLNGQKVKIKNGEGMVMIDNATVLATDIICTNGVIHVIDNVILPEMEG